MTDRKRDPLPEGYQFGDARPRLTCATEKPSVVEVEDLDYFDRMPRYQRDFDADRDTGDEA